MTKTTDILATRRKFLSSSIAVAATARLRLPLFAESTVRLRELRLATDPLRPQFHLLPAANWMNDPNGPIFWNGQYHMFYQYNPDASVWGNMHWAHSVSLDMIHWTHLPGGLAPSPGGPDAAGCFTGSAIIEGNRVVVLYTGVVNNPSGKTPRLRESQCLAYSDDRRLIRWTKLDHPVIPDPPPDLNTTGFRDPSVWKQDGWYYMTVGSGIAHVGGAVLLYRSKDLKQWTYLHILASGPWSGISSNLAESGDMWECPEFFALDGKHVLIYSAEGKVFWHSGTLDIDTMLFHGEKHGFLDMGSYYAAKTQLDADGRRIIWGWILETRPEAQFRAAGWAGMMSLPRVLNLDKDGVLQMRGSCRSSLRCGQDRQYL